MAVSDEKVSQPTEGYAAAPLAPAEPVGGDRRMAAWKIVALTLGGVFGALLIFGAGFVLGVATSGVAQTAGSVPGGAPVGGSSSSDSGSGSATEGEGSGDAPAGAPVAGFDECLVGTWQTVEYEQRASTPQGESVLTGLNRTFTFDAAGRHVVTYDNVEATMTVDGGASPMIFDGTAEYQVSLSGSQMSFELIASDGTTTVVAPDGTQDQRELQPGTGAVTYTCAGDTYTEEDGQGFREVATRVS